MDAAKIQHTEEKTEPVVKSLPGNAGRSMPQTLCSTANKLNEHSDSEFQPDDLAIFLISQAGE